MNGWIKHYRDGTKYIGSDKAIDAGQASWRSSPMGNMSGVEIYDNEMIIEIYSNTSTQFWQEDVFEASMSASVVKPTRVYRRVMCKILSDNCYYRFIKSDHRLIITLEQPPQDRTYPAQTDQIGNWIVGEIDCRGRSFNTYIRDDVQCNS